MRLRAGDGGAERGGLRSNLQRLQPELCGEFMEAMQKQRLRPNLIVCNVALACFLDLDRWPEALQLLAEMDTSGPEPNAVSLRAVAEAMALTSRSSRPLLCRLDVAVRQLLYPDIQNPPP